MAPSHDLSPLRVIPLSPCLERGSKLTKDWRLRVTRGPCSVQRHNLWVKGGNGRCPRGGPIYPEADLLATMHSPRGLATGLHTVHVFEGGHEAAPAAPGRTPRTLGP